MASKKLIGTSWPWMLWLLLLLLRNFIFLGGFQKRILNNFTFINIVDSFYIVLLFLCVIKIEPRFALFEFKSPSVS